VGTDPGLLFFLSSHSHCIWDTLPNHLFRQVLGLADGMKDTVHDPKLALWMATSFYRRSSDKLPKNLLCRVEIIGIFVNS
jgi:hypothetical protein